MGGCMMTREERLFNIIRLQKRLISEYHTLTAATLGAVIASGIPSELIIRNKEKIQQLNKEIDFQIELLKQPTEPEKEKEG